MSIRNDVTISWSRSPRIIHVAKPSDELSAQDLLDTCRNFEDRPENSDDPHLVNASGKENLGGGVSVGITLELQNSIVAFEQRGVSDESGTATTANAAGTSLIDTAATFESNSILPGATVINFTDQSVCTVIEVISETELLCYPLEDGSDNEWEVGDVYKVFNVDQCEISGGNVVAIDDVGAEADAAMPTAFTQLVRTSASSATLQEQAAIQYASFSGGVTIDTVNGVAGTTGDASNPIGTAKNPVNNLADALTIASTRGLGSLYFVSDYTFDNTTYINGLNVYGTGMQGVLLTFQFGSIVVGSLYNANLTGNTAGVTYFENSLLEDFGGPAPIPSSAEIIIKDCLISGNLIMPSDFTGSISVLGLMTGEAEVANAPTFDFNGAACDILCRELAGAVKIKNCTHANANLSLDLSSGSVELESTVTAGDIVIRGTGSCIDNSGSSANVNTDGLSPYSYLETIQHASFNGGVLIDVTSSYTGTDFPIGTPQAPVNNVADALTIADSRGFNTLFVNGNLTLDDSVDLEEMHVVGSSKAKTTITIEASADVENCEFYDATVQGVLDGGNVIKDCVVNNLQYVNGYIELCVISGTITLGGGAAAYFLDCWAGSLLGVPPVIDLGGSGQTLVMQNFNGYIKWRNLTGAADQANASLNAGWLVLENTMTGGSANIIGVGTVENYSNGTLVNTDHLTCPASVANAVWTDSIGEFVRQMEGGRWKIDTNTNQMIFYKKDNTTEIARFNLFDASGNPASDNVYERRRVAATTTTTTSTTSTTSTYTTTSTTTTTTS